MRFDRRELAGAVADLGVFVPIAVTLIVANGLSATAVLLAGFLATAGLIHIGLLRDLRGARAWLMALVVGVVGFQVDLAFALGLGLLVWWAPIGVRHVRSRIAPTAA